MANTPLTTQTQLTPQQMAEAERLKLASPAILQPSGTSTPAPSPVLQPKATVLPGLKPLGATVPGPTAPAENWTAWVPLLKNLTRTHVNRWITQAEIITGMVQGSVAVTQPGTFRSSYPLSAMLLQDLLSGNVPAAVAGSLSSTIGGAWSDWSNSLTIPGLPFYPSFVAWPGPSAPPTPNVPGPLAACVAPGLASLVSGPLALRLTGTLPAGVDRQAATAPLQDFASWFSGRFVAWQAGAMLQNVLGWGPVPSFAPPYVPVGSVMGGTLRATPGFLTQSFT